MGKIIDLTGNRFGRLTVLRQSDVRDSAHIKWVCLCDCGAEKAVAGLKLKNGHTQSCGCLHIEAVTKHGQTVNGKRTPEAQALMNAIGRCHDPRHPQFDNYGARGIRVCKRWREPNGAGVANFLADMGKRPAGYSLERKDNDSGYSPRNCCWDTRKAQTRNRRKSYPSVTYRGVTLPIADWPARLRIQVSWETLAMRIFKLHWTPQRAFTTPVRRISK